SEHDLRGLEAEFLPDPGSVGVPDAIGPEDGDARPLAPPDDGGRVGALVVCGLEAAESLAGRLAAVLVTVPRAEQGLAGIGVEPWPQDLLRPRPEGDLTILPEMLRLVLIRLIDPLGAGAVDLPGGHAADLAGPHAAAQLQLQHGPDRRGDVGQDRADV